MNQVIFLIKGNEHLYYSTTVEQRRAVNFK